jgi:hypothetical protein
MSILTFIIGIIVSTIIIYIITKLLGEKEGIKTAFFAAVIGSVVFGVVHLFTSGLLAAAIAGIVWFFALKWLYNMGWLKTIVVAVILWVVASIVGAILPTGMGPF